MNAKPLLEDSWPNTRKIYEWGRFDPIIGAVLTQRRMKLLAWQEAIELMVLLLADAKHTATEYAIDAELRAFPKTIFPPKESQ